MELKPFKLVTIFSDDALQDEIITELKKCGVKGYTIEDAKGEGLHRARLSELEGTIIRIETVCNNAKCDEVMKMLSEKFFNEFSVIAYVSDVQVLRNERF